MKKLLFTSFVFLAFILIASSQANAQKVDAVYYDWKVFTLKESGKAKKCYIASFPKNKIGNHKVERKPYILITKYKGKRNEEVSVYSGYEYKISSEIYVVIDNEQHRMFTEGDVAWAKTMQEDKKMIQEMLKGDVMKVRGESAIGTYSVDEYSLRGVTKAYKRIKELCK